MSARSFDPFALLAALERERVAYVIVGGFAALVHGSGLPTAGLDITPSLRPDNLVRLQAALDELGARPAGGGQLAAEAQELAREPLTALRTRHGTLTIVPTPAGTRGYDDLRRGAAREPLGQGLRPAVAALDDIIRSLDTLARPEDEQRLTRLRRLAELDRTHGLEL
jgi:hypothetical protein